MDRQASHALRSSIHRELWDIFVPQEHSLSKVARIAELRDLNVVLFDADAARLDNVQADLLDLLPLLIYPLTSLEVNDARSTTGDLPSFGAHQRAEQMYFIEQRVMLL